MTAGAASVLDVATPHGPGRLHLHRTGLPVKATLLLSHGAGAGVETPDLAALAAHLPAQGFDVALFEQPWRVAGRRLATAPPTLDVAFVRAAEVLAVEVEVAGPWIVGGRSAGARSAARTAHALGAVGCLALAFPLHPPGRPESSRLPELVGAGVPVLLVQGERDPMGRPGEFPNALGAEVSAEVADAGGHGRVRDVELAVVPGADHSFVVARRGALNQAEALDLVVARVLGWLVRVV